MPLEECLLRRERCRGDGVVAADEEPHRLEDRRDVVLDELRVGPAAKAERGQPVEEE